MTKNFNFYSPSIDLARKINFKGNRSYYFELFFYGHQIKKKTHLRKQLNFFKIYL